MAVLNKIRQRSLILILVIALALFSFVIGDLFKKKPMIITDLSYSWDTETPWEITNGAQAPMYTNVSISFTVLGDKPSRSSSVYSISAIEINNVDSLLSRLNEQGNS